MKKLLIAILAASGAAIVYAHAETGDRDGRNGLRAEMRSLISGDGMTVEDLTGLMQERSQARFQTLDADGDGVVSREQFLAAAGERAERRFERMGPDEDGVVKRSGREGWGRHHRDGPRAEGRDGKEPKSAEQRTKRLEERAGRQFSRLDADGDGMISREEYQAGMKERGERRAERGERFAGRRGEMPAEMREMHAALRALMRDGMTLESFTGLVREHAGARFDRLDADGNGELTAAEFTASAAERAERLFARMDRNEDGVVTRDDRPRGGKHRHGPRN